tara:strand:+ start:230 stop:514 length:285 start_codon:yes stop_codon:yes gene_type:complete
MNRRRASAFIDSCSDGFAQGTTMAAGGATTVEQSRSSGRQTSAILMTEAGCAAADERRWSAYHACLSAMLRAAQRRGAPRPRRAVAAKYVEGCY